MARPADQETAVVEKTILLYSQFPGGQSMAWHGMAWGTYGEAPGWVRRQREHGDRWVRAFIMAEAG